MLMFNNMRDLSIKTVLILAGEVVTEGIIMTVGMIYKYAPCSSSVSSSNLQSRIWERLSEKVDI